MTSAIPATSGIYRITCTATGNIYVGSTKNLRKRHNTHFAELQRKKHYNAKLQRAFNKYGPDTFTFEVLELVLVLDMLIAREQYWLDTLKPFGRRGYNIDRVAGSTRLGYTFSLESRAKMRLSHLGQINHNRGKKAPPGAIAKMNAARVGKPGPRLGKKNSPEHCAKMSAARKGKPNPHPGIERTPEARAKIAKASRDRKHRPESIEKLRLTKLGNTHGAKDYIVTSPEGIEYAVHNLTAFCKEHGLTQQTLSLVASGKRTHHKGWKARLV